MLPQIPSFSTRVSQASVCVFASGSVIPGGLPTPLPLPPGCRVGGTAEDTGMVCGCGKER